MIEPDLLYAAPDAVVRLYFQKEVSLNEPIADESGEESGDSLQDLVVDPRPGPEDIVFCKELRTLLHRMYRKLPPGQKRVAKLYYIKDKNQIEIAQRLNISPPAVSQTLSIINRKLRALAPVVLGMQVA